MGTYAQTYWSTGGNDAANGDFLGTTNSRPLIFKAGNAERMRFLATGNLGIGTADPAEMLHITGNILSEGDLTVKDKITLTPDYEGEDSFWEIERTSNGLNFLHTSYTAHSDTNYTKGGSNPVAFNRLFISNGGNVGIGSTRPAAQLDVNGSANIARALTASALRAESADITGALSAESANISGTLTANLLSAPSAKITGLVCAQEVKVQLSGSPCWPDYVFGKNYNLMPLPELQSFITENQHLPNIPSAAEVEENGVELGEMNAKLLQKVEELTLYILDLQKQIDELKTK